MRKTRIVGLVLMSVVLTLSSCSSMKSIRLYDESMVSSEEAVHIEVTGDVDVLSVDDQIVGGLGNLFVPSEREFLVAPGEHVLTVRYSDLIDYDGGHYDRFKSSSLSLMFKAEAGEHYQLAHPKLENTEDMEAFAAEPDIWIEKVTGEKSEGVRLSRVVVKEEVQPKSEPQQDDTSKTETSLKDDWDSLTPEEKALFREWLKSRG